MNLVVNIVVAQAGACANGSASVPVDVPCKANAGVKLLVMRLYAGVTLEPWVSRIAEPRRRILHHRAADAPVERIEVEVVDVGVVEVHRQEWIPHHAVVQREAIELPRVLHVRGGDWLRHANWIRVRLPMLTDAAREEIRHGVAGELSGKRVAADRPGIGHRV